MGRVPEEIINKIIDQNDIVDVISEFVPLKKSGRNYMGVCPFHGDKGPSMSVSSEKQLYHCFGCGASGNTVGFVMRIRNMDFIDAIKYLGDKVGIQVSDEPDSPELRRVNQLKNKIYEMNVEAARFYFKNLFSSKPAYNYLINRSLDEKNIKKFGLGFSFNSRDSLLKHLKSKGYKEELIFKAGLINNKDNIYFDKFRNRIMFPVFDIKGRVIGFGGRVMDDSKPKYLNSPETPVFVKGTNLYGLNFAIKPTLPENIIIVEGYMDLIAMHQHGVTNTVASLGTAMTLDQAKLLRRYSKDIFICYDADAAGQTATLRGLDILSKVGCNVKVIMIPKGKDPDEFIKIFGIEEFKNLIKNAIPITEYRILRAREGKNLKDATQKTEFVNSVAEILSNMDSEIEIQAFASKTYDETGIDISSILEEVKKIKHTKAEKDNNTVKTNTNIQPKGLEPAYKKAERMLLTFSLSKSDYFNYIKNKISADEFISNVYSKAANYLFVRLERGEDISPNDLLREFHQREDIDDISRIFLTTDNIEEIQKAIDDNIRIIKKLNLENKINELTLEIKKHEEKMDIVKSAALSQKKILLTKQLSML